MATSKNDKKFVLTIIGACIAVILIFHFAWAKQLFINYKNPFFTFIDGGLIALFIYEAVAAYHFEGDYAKDWLRRLIVWVAVASSAWAAGWSAGVNEKTMFEQDVERAKQTSYIQRHSGLFYVLTPEEIFEANIIQLGSSSGVYLPGSVRNIRWMPKSTIPIPPLDNVANPNEPEIIVAPPFSVVNSVPACEGHRRLHPHPLRALPSLNEIVVKRIMPHCGGIITGNYIEGHPRIFHRN